MSSHMNRLYKSPAEVLMGFDIDSCAVCYDGTTVWALNRARRALNKQYNIVDMGMINYNQLL